MLGTPVEADSNMMSEETIIYDSEIIQLGSTYWFQVRPVRKGTLGPPPEASTISCNPSDEDKAQRHQEEHYRLLSGCLTSTWSLSLLFILTGFCWAHTHILDYSDGEMMDRSVWLADSSSGWMWTGSGGRGLEEEGLHGEAKFSQWLCWGGANPLYTELSGLGIRELCLYARHLLSIMMSHSGPYQVPWRGGGVEWMRKLFQGTKTFTVNFIDFEDGDLASRKLWHFIDNNLSISTQK